jgi:hypothetical protein
VAAAIGFGVGARHPSSARERTAVCQADRDAAAVT